MKTPKLILAAVALATAASTHAAPIIWGAPQNITGDADVSLDGSLVRAFNVGDTGVAATTVNTVNFESFAVPAGSAGATVGNFTIATAPAGSHNTLGGSTAAPFSTLSSAYQTLLAARLHQGFGFTLTISGLSVGEQYEFQWWCNESQTAQTQHSATADGSTVTLLNRIPNNNGGIGQYAIGTFTADAAPQTITFSGVAPGGILNGFQVRQVPEPSTWVMLAAGAGSLLGFRRRRKAKYTSRPHKL